MREAVQAAGYCWDAVAEHMKGRRAAGECRQRWVYLYGDEDQVEHVWGIMILVMGSHMKQSVVDESCYKAFTADEVSSTIGCVLGYNITRN